MRITTQMLNASMRKAGLPVNHVSLLNYVNSSSQSNSLLSALNKNGIKLQDKDKLKQIGITRSEDGMLRVDEDKLKASDVDKLEEILGVKGTFSSKVSFLADRIADNARANASSASSQYNALGDNYFASASRYSFWG